MAYLLGMSVHQMCTTMHYDEFAKWVQFFKHRPAGWREDHRTAMIMQSFGTKAKGHELFSSLAQMKTVEDQAKNLAESGTITGATVMSKSNFQNSLFFSKMIGAKGGDKLES